MYSETCEPAEPQREGKLSHPISVV